MMLNSAYVQFLVTTFTHAFFDMIKRRRNQVIGAVILLPALIPLLLLVLPKSVDFTTSDTFVFTQMIEIFYIRAVTPLLALFLGAMLIGEDIESQTIPYILSRPIPRSAWVTGRFLAYLAASSLLLFVTLTVTFVSCSILEISFPSLDNLLLLFQYQGTAIMSLLGYGAICMLIGALVRRPIIVGILLIFLWQRLAMFAPGLSDYFTIEKYVNALTPGGGTNVISILEETAFQVIKSGMAITPFWAALALIAIAAACIAGTTRAVLKKEYTTPTAVTE